MQTFIKKTLWKFLKMLPTLMLSGYNKTITTTKTYFKAICHILLFWPYSKPTKGALPGYSCGTGQFTLIKPSI